MSKISRDWVEAYFDYGIDLVNRCIFLVGDINQETIGHVIKGMYLMENQNTEYKPIELRISSYGGDVYDAYGLHDTTRTLKSPVYTMGTGKIMSAAVLLVACGEKGQRWAGENTTFMVHVPSWDTNDETLHNHKIEVAEGERLWNRWYELMGKYTKKPASFWRKLCSKNTDHYFDAEQALEWGVIDNIWLEKQDDQ